MFRCVIIILSTTLLVSAAFAAEDEAWLLNRHTLPLWAVADEVEAAHSASAVETSEEAAEALEEEAADSVSAVESYEEATEALNEDRWDEAVDKFEEVAVAKSHLSDGAIYWKAYALAKLGQRLKALETLSAFRKPSAASRWAKDAKALELEIRQASGQTIAPDAESDDDLKLVVISSLMNSNPDRAVPLLEKVLEGGSSPKLKEHALFVLSQSGSPKAREILGKFAKGGANPDLQMRSVEYLGLYGGQENGALLAEIFASTVELDVKRKILSSFMLSGDQSRLLQIAKSEKDDRLRGEAIQQLGLMGNHDGLWELYQTEPSLKLRKHILEALFLGGNADMLINVARTEKDPELRLTAIQQLGLVGQDKCGDALVSLYSSSKSPEEREAILSALWLQGNVDALVALARAEKDPAVKRSIVEKLSMMGSDKATEYMIELLAK